MRIFLLITASFVYATGIGQKPYTIKDRVQDLAIPVVLNAAAKEGKLSTFQKDITIIDFFGTWCIPCLKALPQLTAIQQSNTARVAVLLVSNEKQGTLQKFINTRNPFPFPVIIDRENEWTKKFAPPLFPYTVVIDKHGTILAITDAASITPDMITGWLQGKKTTFINKVPPQMDLVSANLKSSNQLVELSQLLIYAVKTSEPAHTLTEQLAALSFDSLRNGLLSDPEKKAFWINLYNGYTQLLLKQDPGRYQHRGKFFRSKQIRVAGILFSLDDIEHGILRKSKIKWSLGHLSKLFPNKTEKQLRVDQPDYRIHFALNCGAKSCPPIAFYSPEKINPQLELATNAYLQSEVAYDSTSNTVHLPAMMSWFRKDFGGKKQMIRLLKEKKIIPQESDPRIRFNAYDWTLYTDHFNNLNQ